MRKKHIYNGLKTNSAIVRQRVVEYLNECMSKTDRFQTFEDIRNDITRVKGSCYVKDAIDWLRGIPLPINYYYDDIAKIMSEWLEDSVESQWHYLKVNGDTMYWHLMAREICNLKNQ